jgi:ABC-type transport system involved in multi-copper enzyme maturation permease subunit
MLRDNPIFLREIRPGFWPKSSRISRYIMLTALAAVLAIPTVIALRYWKEIDGESATLFLMAFTYWPGFICPALTPALVAGTIAGERERQTWDALVLTRLGPGEIIWGKLLSRLFPLALVTLVLLPLVLAFAVHADPSALMPSGMRNVSDADQLNFWWMLTWLIGLGSAFANGVLAMYISLRARSARSALLVTYGIAGGVYIFSKIIGYVLFSVYLFAVMPSHYSSGTNPGFPDFLLALTITQLPVLAWAVVIPLVLLPQLIGGFSRIDRRVRGG